MKPFLVLVLTFHAIICEANAASRRASNKNVFEWTVNSSVAGQSKNLILCSKTKPPCELVLRETPTRDGKISEKRMLKQTGIFPLRETLFRNHAPSRKILKDAWLGKGSKLGSTPPFKESDLSGRSITPVTFGAGESVEFLLGLTPLNCVVRNRDEVFFIDEGCDRLFSMPMLEHEVWYLVEAEISGKKRNVWLEMTKENAAMFASGS